MDRTGIISILTKGCGLWVSLPGYESWRCGGEEGLVGLSVNVTIEVGIQQQCYLWIMWIHLSLLGCCCWRRFGWGVVLVLQWGDSRAVPRGCFSEVMASAESVVAGASGVVRGGLEDQGGLRVAPGVAQTTREFL